MLGNSSHSSRAQLLEEPRMKNSDKNNSMEEGESPGI